MAAVLSRQLDALPISDPVLYWRGRAARRCILDVSWGETKEILRRVLRGYRATNALEGLISSDLGERGGCTHLRTAAGHEIGLVRPTTLCATPLAGDPVLLAREENGALRSAVIVADIDEARQVLRGWIRDGLCGQPHKWASYLGERGESRAGLVWLEALEHPLRSSARTELEVAVRIELAERNDRLRRAA